MSLAVFWTDEANDTFDSIVLLIETKWTDKEAADFVNHANKVITLISD
jgi:plasmid stabilization system protein ParE